ncbi:hypothetical protein TNCV_1712261 [Trichonephila clavipes]|nr:hypothetical protein TNCV_1712261 [Trichonephila clavipes]
METWRNLDDRAKLVSILVTNWMSSHIHQCSRVRMKISHTQKVCNLLTSLNNPDNMLTKYQMIKFMDFREVWFLLKSVATEYPPLLEITAATRLGIDSKRLLMWGKADQAASTRCQS